MFMLKPYVYRESFFVRFMFQQVQLIVMHVLYPNKYR